MVNLLNVVNDSIKKKSIISQTGLNVPDNHLMWNYV